MAHCCLWHFHGVVFVAVAPGFDSLRARDAGDACEEFRRSLSRRDADGSSAGRCRSGAGAELAGHFSSRKKSVSSRVSPPLSLRGWRPRSFLNAADWTVILLYIGGIVALGTWFGRGQHNTRDYFLGGKDIPWWGIGLSIVAAETSALTIIGVPAMAYGKNGDLSFIQLIIGYVIARIILAVVMVPHYLKGEIYSPYQLFSDAFGENARRTAGGFFFLSETLAAGVRVYVACIPVKLMLGDKLLGSFAGGDPILGAILFFVVFSLVYTFVGGVKAVIWTDAAQFGLFLLGGLVHPVVCAAFFSGRFGRVFRTAAAAGKLHWFNADVTASHCLARTDEHLDGRHWRNIHGDGVPRGGTTHRPTGAGLQDCARRTQGRWL